MRDFNLKIKIQKCYIHHTCFIECDLNSVFEIERSPIMLWSIIVGRSYWSHCRRNHKKGGSMGIIANVLAGLIGSSVGTIPLGTWGPSLAGMALLPSPLELSLLFVSFHSS